METRPTRPDTMHLHSRYDPVREADRFVASSLQDSNPSVIILLGAALGYVVRSIRRRFPEARLIALYHDPDVYAGSMDRPELSWHPGQPTALEPWLHRHLHELDLEGLRVLEWLPSARSRPGPAGAAREALEQVLRELRGSLVTTAGLGRRWLRNSFLNFTRIETLLRFTGTAQDTRPILIAASGPSLERSRALLRAHRHRLRVWALPSAALFLREEGVTPDLVVLTDPGYYAMVHLHPLSGRPFRLAMPLSAAPGSWKLPAGVFLISQENFFERALLERAGLPSPRVPPHGTVTATALELALRLTRAPVIVAGLDLCTHDLLSHARPDTFEPFLQPAVSRLSPLHSLLFREAAERTPRRLPVLGAPSRSGLTLETYAGWLSAYGRSGFADPAGRSHPAPSDLRSGAGRVYRLHPSAIPLQGFRELDEGGFAALLDRASRGAVAGDGDWTSLEGAPHIEARRQAAVDLLEVWSDRLAAGRRAVENSRSIQPLVGDAFLLNFCYFHRTAALVELKKTSRLNGSRAAFPLAAALLEEARVFTDALALELHGPGGRGR